MSESTDIPLQSLLSVLPCACVVVPVGQLIHVVEEWSVGW